jgi:PTH1 family peptidyl-tRNA hydrolase
MENYLIIGLGNPGKEYKFTRHNIGFRIIENWLINLSVTIPDCPCQLRTEKKHQAEVSKVKFPNQTIILAEPQTFMNKSGIAIKSLANYYDIPIDNILIIHDDLSFEFEKFKLSKNAGPAGHNGVKSAIEHLGSKEFHRLRIGISMPAGNCPVGHQGGHNFVLGKFSKDEEEKMSTLLQTTSALLDSFIKNGPEKTANEFN